MEKQKSNAKEQGVKNPGFSLKAPGPSCTDKKCPFHGDIKVRGRTFTGVILKSKAQKTASVSWIRRRYIPKYERYEKRRTKILVHNPPCFNAEKGEVVKIMECRPLSKTKHFIIVGKTGEKEIIGEELPEEPAEKPKTKLKSEPKKQKSKEDKPGDR